MRPQMHDLLADIVSARVRLYALEAQIIAEMHQGYRPTYRGHEWGIEHFDALQRVSRALDTAFAYLKWLQFPEVNSRLNEARILEGGLHGELGSAERPATHTISASAS